MKKLILTTMAVLTLAGAATADIYVKYQGWVDETNMADLWTQPSSLVKNIWYDNYNEYLIVDLKGTNYHYCGIPEDEVHDWQFAPSLGRYYYQNIKGNYDCRYQGTIPGY